jgi:6-pyruvoyltetrahydropterin/6-carboxytetrahydropterin synthase
MNPNFFISTKRFTGFPCTHRQWKADSHCRFVHGYSREFYFEFAASELTKEGWVVDFGGLKEIKAWLDEMFDHTFLASADDPYMENFKKLEQDGIIQLRVLPNAGMEGTAVYVFEHINNMVRKMTNNRAWLKRIEVRENEKNSAFYEPTT